MLYQKCRPNKFCDIVGNKQVVKGLEQVVKSKKRPHTYMFVGQTGCGKTTLARILAKEFGCDGISLTEINSANFNGIKTAREIADSINIAPMFGDAKCYICDESHELTSAAQQALLKVIEDCPEYVYFIFCTTDPNKIISTIRNRCAIYKVTPLRPSEMKVLLENTCKSEKIKWGGDEDVIQAITKASKGCPRQGLMLLEQIQDIEDPKEILEFISSAETGSKEVIELIREIVSGRANRWRRCVDLYTKVSADPETIRLSVLGYLRKMLLNANSLEEAGQIVEMIHIFKHPTYSGGGAILLGQIFESSLI